MRRLGTATVGALVIVMLASTMAAAYGGPEISASACGGGKLVINITHKVIGDQDGGFNGGWAWDSYNRQVQVWQTGPDTYCATTNYSGQFVTIPGRTSPGSGSTNVLAAAVKGTFEGGYRSTQFTGTLNPTPAYPTRGNLGTFDYACTSPDVCPGAFSWTGTYFSSAPDFDLAWWGWEYKYKNQRWINAIDGSSGDITG